MSARALDAAIRRFPFLLALADNYGVESDAVALCIDRCWFEIMAEYRRELSSCTR